MRADAASARRICELEASAFPHRRAYRSPEEVAQLAADPGVFILTDEGQQRGYLILRLAAGQGEILDLGVIPMARRQGVGQALVREALTLARQSSAVELFLEVDRCNHPARELYQTIAFEECGVRKGYYRNADGSRSDALVLRRAL